jgi:hypothetical protein
VLPSDVGLFPLPIDTGCDDPLLFQPFGQSSPGLLADVVFLEGSASTLCNGVGSFVATAGYVAELRVAVVFELPPKLVVVIGVLIGDCGTSNGGDGMEVPMLVQPPSTGVTPLDVAAAPRPAVAFDGHPGAFEAAPGVVGQGEVVPFGVEPYVGAVVDGWPVTALRVESHAWLAPRES